MGNILTVNNLCKNYEAFSLKNVSFSLDKGYIMGFIGRNGAGKTTTLKTMFNLVHHDSGAVEMFGKDFFENELFCKQHSSFMLGGANYFVSKKLKTIKSVVKKFYDEWDDEAYKSYISLFKLDENKKVSELSEGMKVKFGLALAMSHNAKFLVLDEPTSGLDPVSRDELLEIFQKLIADGERSILFSTHIISDLEKCADYITYIKEGEILASTEKDAFIDGYRVVQGKNDQLNDEMKKKLIGIKNNAFGWNALIKKEDLSLVKGLEIALPDLETIMVHIEKE